MIVYSVAVYHGSDGTVFPINHSLCGRYEKSWPLAYDSAGNISSQIVSWWSMSPWTNSLFRNTRRRLMLASFGKNTEPLLLHRRSGSVFFSTTSISPRLDLCLESINLHASRHSSVFPGWNRETDSFWCAGDSPMLGRVEAVVWEFLPCLFPSKSQFIDCQLCWRT